MVSVSNAPDPRGEIPLSEHDRTHLRVLSREEWLSRPNHSLPGADVPGSMRILYRALTATNCRTSLVAMPMGQTAPRHNSKNQHIITVLAGAFEFVVDDARYRVRELEQIFIPVGTF